jgi:hypothetical protein
MGKRRRLSSEQIQDELSKTSSQPFVTVLESLFTDPKMFSSFDRFRDAGFHLVDHAETKIMAGSHRRLRGYLIKKYNNDRSGKDQLRSYMHRIEGARLLREFIAERNFQHVVAPQKFLYELPPSFPERYLVIAEKLDLMSRRDTERSYEKMDRTQGRELAVVLYYFRGLNSTAENLPFTEDGKIAFIDTERWHHDKDLLRKVGDRLSGKRREEVEDVHRELSRQGARPFVSSFK